MVRRMRPMLLKKGEICSRQKECPYFRQGEEKCRGAVPRDSEFVCFFVIDGKIVEPSYLEELRAKGIDVFGKPM